MNKQDLRTAILVANNGAYGSIGTQIPADMRRYVYRIRAMNLFAGANLLTVARGPALAEVVIDNTIQAMLLGDIWNDPEELTEASLPLYIFEAADQFIRLITDNGNMNVLIIYADEP